MTYRVKEIFRTLQGEGFHAGTPAVFVRFAGCNLWSGHDKDRQRDAARHEAICPKFCDTDFVGGEKYTAEDLAEKLASLGGRDRLVVFTGGEPSLQWDPALLDALLLAGFSRHLLAMETNGITELNPRPGWVTVSPKTETWVMAPDELKVVYPAYSPFAAINRYGLLYPGGMTPHLFIQPEDGPGQEDNIQRCIEFVQKNPVWRLSLQTHKMLGLP